MGMTEKQKRFADEYLIDLNATRAYKVAYPNTKKDEAASAAASRLLRNVKVKAYIDEQVEKIHSEKIANAREVEEYLTSVMRGEIKEDCLRLDGDGVQVIEQTRTPLRERTKAAELLGKRYGMFTDKVEVKDAVLVVFKDDLEEDDTG